MRRVNQVATCRDDGSKEDNAMEVTMPKSTLVAAGALAAAVATSALLTPAAMAEAPKCKVKGANSFVACTDRIKAKTKTRKLPAVQKVRQGSRATPYGDGSVRFLADTWTYPATPTQTRKGSQK
jgi:DMSO/TMAO reductase YedYZ molybdopterin-dependent catalytic subunit